MQITQEAKHKIKTARDHGVIPADAGAELEGYGGDFVLDPFSFDAAGFTRVDFDDVRLREGCEALVVGLAVVGIYPHGPVRTGGQRVHVHGDVDVGGVAPEISPDSICVAFWLAGACGRIDRVDAGEDAVQVCEKPIFGAGEDWVEIVRKRVLK